MTVFSEPPELEVFLDGSKVGQTPVWLERVQQGFHKLRVEDPEKKIHVEPGKRLRVGLFKGDFVVFPEKESYLFTSVPLYTPSLKFSLLLTFA